MVVVLLAVVVAASVVEHSGKSPVPGAFVLSTRKSLPPKCLLQESLCSGWLPTLCVAKDALELLMLLPEPPECWDCRCAPPVTLPLGSAGGGMWGFLLAKDELC